MANGGGGGGAHDTRPAPWSAERRRTGRACRRRSRTDGHLGGAKPDRAGRRRCQDRRRGWHHREFALALEDHDAAGAVHFPADPDEVAYPGRCRLTAHPYHHLRGFPLAPAECQREFRWSAAGDHPAKDACVRECDVARLVHAQIPPQEYPESLTPGLPEGKQIVDSYADFPLEPCQAVSYPCPESRQAVWHGSARHLHLSGRLCSAQVPQHQVGAF
jgi:hypothetical protein